MRLRRSLVAPLLSLLAAPLLIGAAGEQVVRREGLNLNSFTQSGSVAAHVLLRDGQDPRLIVAFPAGNSGVGLWFDRVAGPTRWTMADAARPVTTTDARGRALRGVTFAATIQARELRVKQAVLTSIRVLRDYQALGTVPDGLAPTLTQERGTLTWARDRLDGGAGYRLSLRVDRGTLHGTTLTAAKDGTIEITVTALTGEVPLTPFRPGELLEPTAANDPQARAALQFLSYREKFLAGSWRFLTYFGRDTLLSVRLLMPALRPDAVDTGLRSVLERLSPDGVVAHEEDIGEFAILDHRRDGGGLSDAPTYNYAMVDSPFLLAPVAGAWLIDDARGRARAARFLAAPLGHERAGDALMRNVRFVVAAAAPFTRDPDWRRMISLKPGMDAGEWRDSNDGLGGGRYPYDINAVLVPAALEAIDAMARAGLLAPFAKPEDRTMLAQVHGMAATWASRAPGYFAQTVTPAAAQAAISRYAAQVGVPAGPALAAATQPLRYNAISLDAQGRAVPIVHSDDGFALLFQHPDAAALNTAATTISAPFPAGLMTGAGMLVANPVFAPTALQARFSPAAYHGTVVWSWQQALVAAGIDRQLARSDLPPATCARLTDAQAKLWQAIDASRSVQSSELWSWRYADGAYRIAPFGAAGGDADESNAAQLWSTVYLAVRRPVGAPACHRR
ncbi:hypothetical protein SAMN05192583_0651 [Sphingomonas gellani]|uniref:Lipoprotein n=1 Tax=Sphingomonas gellani TaxID=1166340 RepID=A0A1H7ZG46_9SPHN|nr:hypothetical protein [Sphingomonas gellani]SEM56489.1 hypothetical protein SAMN05192583_0651 [Sphingomonas gellani]